MSNDFIATLYEKYLPELLRYCEYLLHYDPKYRAQVEEIVHDVFVVAIQKQEQLIRHPNPYAWLTKTCWNKCYTLLRKDFKRAKQTGQRVEYIDTLTVEAQQDLIVQLLKKMDAEAFVQALQEQLTPLERQNFPLYFVERRSMRDTAETVGLDASKLNDAIRRIRRKAIRMKWLILFFPVTPIFSHLCDILSEGRFR